MKSTITCDMEGIIETMNSGAEKIFGYEKDELIGKKRVSIFSNCCTTFSHFSLSSSSAHSPVNSVAPEPAFWRAEPSRALAISETSLDRA